MTYIPGTSQSHTTANQASGNQGKQTTTLGQKEFLTLLVAQMQHQDPLSPTDSTAWTAQLAQYSQLEQSVNMNKTMELLVEGQQNSERLSVLSLIGREALVKGTEFTLGKEPVEIGYRVNGTVTGIEILIKDARGQVVTTINPSETGDGNHFVTWDGLDQNSQPLPEGKYSIMIDAHGSGEGETAAVVPLVRTEVNGVNLGEDGAVLLTSTGEFPLSSIYGVYEAR